MSDENALRLFLYNCAVVHSNNPSSSKHVGSTELEKVAQENADLVPYLSQFKRELRETASTMAVWYVLFHMLENDIRQFITETLETKAPGVWWDTCVPDPVKQEVMFNKTREQELGFVPRSDELLDYTTFGQLGDIIRANWDVFGGVLTNQKAVTRIMSTLNALRGPIAHCGVLAPDETDRLKLSIKDWFRLLAGPQ